MIENAHGGIVTISPVGEQSLIAALRGGRPSRTLAIGWTVQRHRHNFSNIAQVMRYSAASQYSRAIERFHFSIDTNGAGKRTT